MNNKVKNFICSNYHWLLLIVMFLSCAFVAHDIQLYLDDFTYKQAGVCGFAQIVQFMKWHIASYNGRTLMHLIVIAFLRYNWGLAIFKVLCPVLMCMSCLLMSKISTDNSADMRIGTVISATLILFTNVCVWNESIYWLTGFFNYFFPTLLVLICMYLGLKKPHTFWLFPLSLICGATTEQGGMMAFGLFVLLLIDNTIKTKKFSVRYLIYCVLSLAGYLTVLLSGGTSDRIGTQESLGISGIINNAIVIFKENWFGNINMWLFLFAVTISISFWFIKFRSKNKLIGKVYKPALAVLWLLSVFNVGIKGLSILGIALPGSLGKIVFILWLIYAVVFFAMFAVSGILIYADSGNPTAFIAFALGSGSQLMMAVSQKSYLRTCLPMLFMYIIFIVISSIEINAYIKNKHTKLKKIKLKPLVSILLIVSCAFQVYTGIGNLHTTEPENINKSFSGLNQEEMDSFTDKLKKDFLDYYTNPDSDWNNKTDVTDFSEY